jgi:hypothetical protein
MPINAFRFGHMPNSVENKAPNNWENYSLDGPCYLGDCNITSFMILAEAAGEGREARGKK